ncbi:alpha-hydroxy-acid oxidizing protein, partial [Micromonospora zamorensis]
ERRARDALTLLAAELTDALTLAGCADPAAAAALRTLDAG